MKNLIKMFALFVLMVAAVSFTACSDDDDDSSSGGGRF